MQMLNSRYAERCSPDTHPTYAATHGRPHRVITAGEIVT